MPKNYGNLSIFVNVSLQMDMLDIVPGQDTFYLLVMAKTFDTSKFIQMKLITKENVSMATMFFKRDCSKNNPDPEQKFPIGEFSPEMEEKFCSPLKCVEDSCAGVFYIFMTFSNNGKIFYNFNGVDRSINETKNKQSDGPNVPNEPKLLIPSIAQIFGDLSLPVETNAFKKIKEMTLNFDRSSGVKLTRYQNVLIHGIMFNPEGKFKIEYFCGNCYTILDEEDYPTADRLSEFLILEFDNHAKTVVATVPNKEGKNETAESPFLLNLKMSKPFTIKITTKWNSSTKQNDYEILLNDEEILSAPAYFVENFLYVYADKINVIGNDIVLLDKISAIPYVLKIETAKNNKNVVNGYKINVKFRLMEAGQIVQIFLAQIPVNLNLAMYLGIDNVKVTESGLKVYEGTVNAHIWAQYDDASGLYKFCFDNKFKLIEKGKKTECKAEAKQDYDYKKMGKIVNAEIAVAKDGTIHVDFNGHSMADLKPNNTENNAAQSTRFVIGGDITLVDEPKQV